MSENATWILIRTFSGHTAHVPPAIEQAKYCNATYRKYENDLPPLAGTVTVIESNATTPLWMNVEGKHLLDSMKSGDHLILTTLKVLGVLKELKLSLIKRFREQGITVHLTDYCRYSGMLDEHILSGLLLERAAVAKEIVRQDGPPTANLPWGWRHAKAKRGPLDYEAGKIPNKSERKTANRLRHRMVNGMSMANILVWIQSFTNEKCAQGSRWRGTDWTYAKIKRVAFEIFEPDDPVLMDYYPEGPDEQRETARSEPDDLHD